MASFLATLFAAALALLHRHRVSWALEVVAAAVMGKLVLELGQCATVRRLHVMCDTLPQFCQFTIN